MHINNIVEVCGKASRHVLAAEIIVEYGRFFVWLRVVWLLRRQVDGIASVFTIYLIYHGHKSVVA